MVEDSVDAVMSIWVWSHLTDLLQASKEMFRLLQSKGNFLIITANPETYETRKTYYKEYKDFGDHLVGTFDLGKGNYLTNTNLQFHTRDQMIGAIINSGLNIDSIETFGLLRRPSRNVYRH
jgi:ubiquinone/menaquinone biosynthesis C-methylase UbiE